VNKKAFAVVLLVAILLGYFLLVDLAAYIAFSHSLVKPKFVENEHYQRVVDLQRSWNVPIWIGEFGSLFGTTGFAQSLPLRPLLIYNRLFGFKPMAERTMVQVVNETGWDWTHWEYEPVSFTDAQLNSIFAPYFEGLWKPGQNIPRIVIDGTEFKTETGLSIVLKGQNVALKNLAFYGWRTPDEVMPQLNSMGLNLIRVVITPESLMTHDGVWNEASLQVLNATLNLSERYGIYVILVMHQFLQSSFWSGSGFPPWYVKRYNFTANLDDAAKFESMWTSKTAPFQDSWNFVLELWKKVINISRGRNIVVGYDLINEVYDNLIPLTEFISNEIEKIDPGKIHFIETPFLFKSLENQTKPNIHHMALSPHFYNLGDAYPSTAASIWILTVAAPILYVVLVKRLVFSKPKERVSAQKKRNDLKSIGTAIVIIR